MCQDKQLDVLLSSLKDWEDNIERIDLSAFITRLYPIFEPVRDQLQHDRAATILSCAECQSHARAFPYAGSNVDRDSYMGRRTSDVTSLTVRPVVFLGGSCGSTTWRVDIAIPLFSSAGISYYNPQVPLWSESLIALETLMKAACPFLLFVVSGATRSATSLVEAAEYIAARRNVVLVVEDMVAGMTIGSDVVSAGEALDFNRGRAYLRNTALRYGAPVFHSVADGCQAIVQMRQCAAIHEEHSF